MNEQQRAFWNGEAAERWMARRATLDRQLRPFGDEVLAASAITPGAHVLDIGCGCSDSTLTIGERVGATGRVLGLDVSEPMIARARERAAGRANVRYALADATTYDTDERFDAAVSRFGVMFFEEPAASFANVRRLMRSGGSLVFACWRALADNPWSSLPYEAVARALEIDPIPPSDAPGPFAFADPARVRQILESAGFERIRVRGFDCAVCLGETIDEAVLEASTLGPAGRLVREAGSEENRARALTELRRALERMSAPFELMAAAWIVCARAP